MILWTSDVIRPLLYAPQKKSPQREGSIEFNFKKKKKGRNQMNWTHVDDPNNKSARLMGILVSKFAKAR